MVLDKLPADPSWKNAPVFNRLPDEDVDLLHGNYLLQDGPPSQLGL